MPSVKKLVSRLLPREMHSQTKMTVKPSIALREVDCAYEICSVLLPLKIPAGCFVADADDNFQLGREYHLDIKCLQYSRNYVSDLLVHCSECRRRLRMIGNFVEMQDSTDKVQQMLVRPIRIVLRRFFDDCVMAIERFAANSHDLVSTNNFAISFKPQVDKTFEFFKTLLLSKSYSDLFSAHLEDAWNRFLLGVRGGNNFGIELPVWKDLYNELTVLLGQYFDELCVQRRVHLTNGNQDCAMMLHSINQNDAPKTRAPSVLPTSRNRIRDQDMPSLFRPLWTSKLSKDLSLAFRYSENVQKCEEIWFKREKSFQEVYNEQLRRNKSWRPDKFDSLVELLKQSIGRLLTSSFLALNGFLLLVAILLVTPILDVAGAKDAARKCTVLHAKKDECEKVMKSRTLVLHILYGLAGFELLLVVVAVVIFTIGVVMNLRALKQKESLKEPTSQSCSRFPRCPKWLLAVLIVVLFLPDGVSASPLYRRSLPRRPSAVGGVEMVSSAKEFSIGPGKSIDQWVICGKNGSGFEFTAIRPSCLDESSLKDDNKVNVSIGNSDCEMELKWDKDNFYVGDEPPLATWDPLKKEHADVKVELNNGQLFIRRVVDPFSSSVMVASFDCSANFDDVPRGYAMWVKMEGSPRCDIKLQFSEECQKLSTTASPSTTGSSPSTSTGSPKSTTTKRKQEQSNESGQEPSTIHWSFVVVWSVAGVVSVPLLAFMCFAFYRACTKMDREREERSRMHENDRQALRRMAQDNYSAVCPSPKRSLVKKDAAKKSGPGSHVVLQIEHPSAAEQSTQSLSSASKNRDPEARRRPVRMSSDDSVDRAVNKVECTPNKVLQGPPTPMAEEMRKSAEVSLPSAQTPTADRKTATSATPRSLPPGGWM